MTRNNKVPSKIRDQGKHRKRSQRKVSLLLAEQQRRVQTICQNVMLSGDVENLVYQSEPEKEKPVNVKDMLCIWKIKYNITRSAMNDLLRILILCGLTSLPHDCRTLIKTPENLVISDVAGGKFWYQGIESNIRRLFKNLSENATLFLNLNIDGIPLFRSSKVQFWPILANIYGKTKLKLLKYLWQISIFIENF